jgi:hypothetical protein
LNEARMIGLHHPHIVQGFSVYPKGPERVKKKPSLAIIKKT